jgi:hypothetical protein
MLNEVVCMVDSFICGDCKKEVGKVYRKEGEKDKKGGLKMKLRTIGTITNPFFVPVFAGILLSAATIGIWNNFIKIVEKLDE